MRATGIIATIGKSCQRGQILHSMAEKGMDFARINFSHENHKIHSERLKLIQGVNNAYNTGIRVLLDLKGPEVRVDRSDKLSLRKGESILLSRTAGRGKIRLSNPSLLRKLDVGSIVLIDDGTVQLRVTEKRRGGVRCVALSNCVVHPRKSVASEFLTLEQSAITREDQKAIKFANRHEVDFVAVSHVQTPDDILAARELTEVPLIAKIENYRAVQNIKEIAKVSDGVMVARGDLGSNVPLEFLPLIQEHLLSVCASTSTFSIVATQMMESMIANKRPTRAELSDVYLAVRQGANAVMLSGETAIGKYPVETVDYMRRTIETAEHSLSVSRPQLDV